MWPFGKKENKSEEIPPFKGQINQPCYDKYGRFLGWYSRSVASSLFVFCKDKDGDWCVLGQERGKDALDYQGYWNCSCGYLDFNESTKECAMRELKEECGIELSDDEVSFIDFEDKPSANRQNVTFHYIAVIKDKTTKDFKFSKELNEGKEVGDIKWIKLTDVTNYKWAFGHCEKIILYSEAIN